MTLCPTCFLPPDEHPRCCHCNGNTMQRYKGEDLTCIQCGRQPFTDHTFRQVETEWEYKRQNKIPNRVWMSDRPRDRHGRLVRA